MTHSPPVPPGNQSPYPLAEKPPEKPAVTRHVAVQTERDREQTATNVRNGIVAALGIGAVAALIAGIVTATRRSQERPAPRRKGAKGKKNKD